MKAEKVYETFEMPNDRRLGWKTVLSLAFSLVASILIVIVALYADLVDKALTFFVSKYPLPSALLLISIVSYLIYKRAKR